MNHDPDDPFAFEEDALAATALAVEDLFMGRDAVQEAGMYWARGDEVSALSTLERFLADSAAPKEAWWVLFDMLAARGDRKRFEEAALAYAVHFGCSPPVLGDDGEAHGSKLPGAPLVVLPMNLDASAFAPLQERLLRLTKAASEIRLDAARLRRIEPSGAALLLALLKKLLDKGVKIRWLRLDVALSVLEQARRKAGDDRALWELEIVWRTAAGQMERAESLVVDFAGTFEAIPPVWMSDPACVGAESSPAGDASAVPDVPEGELALTGDVDERSISDLVQEILNHSRDHDSIVIDCRDLRRVDFVAAGMLYNAFAALKGQGKQVTLRNVSQVVNALFDVLSMGQVATIQTKVY